MRSWMQLMSAFGDELEAFASGHVVMGEEQK